MTGITNALLTWIVIDRPAYALLLPIIRAVMIDDESEDERKQVNSTHQPKSITLPCKVKFHTSFYLAIPGFGFSGGLQIRGFKTSSDMQNRYAGPPDRLRRLGWAAVSDS